MSAPVSSVISLMILPLGPMTSPILSTGMYSVMTRGALGFISGRGAGISSVMTCRTCRRASLAWARASPSRLAEMPASLVSSCRAVTNSLVPATLKSMSPKASSAPRMSVSVVVWPSWLINPMAMPATGACSGTPPSISDSVEAHTLAIDVEPLEDSTSLTSRRA